MRAPERDDSYEALWSCYLRAMDRALAHHDPRSAIQAWDEAHLAAMSDGHWQGLIEVGRAYLRIGEASGSRRAAEATARKAYFAALFRACQKESFDGIVGTTEAFAALGDRQVVEECVALAELMADGAARRARVRDLLALVSQLPDALPAQAAGEVVAAGRAT
jgi:hypothetical protein